MGRSGLLVAVVVAGILAACGGGGDTAKPGALPRDRGPRLGVTVDAALTGSAPVPNSFDDASTGPAPALTKFDDGDGHGAATPDGAFALGGRQSESLVSATVPGELPPDQLVQGVFDSTGSTALDEGFGVVCRWQDSDNYYRLGIGNDGTYGIARVQHGTDTVLTGAGRWQRDRSLSRTPGQHTIGGECRGNTLTLFADNVPIVSVQDSTFDRPGRVGVFVETFADPNATVTVRRLRAFAYADRAHVPDATIGPWDAFTDTQRLDRTCDLVDPARTGLDGPPVFVTRCGPVTYAKFGDAATATRAYTTILTRAGVGLRNTKGLPNCAKQTGVLGPLPTPALPVPPGTPPGIGRVACLDLGGRTAVVWLDSGTGIVGVRTVADGDRRAWRGYGPSWPPFTAGVTPATTPPA